MTTRATPRDTTGPASTGHIPAADGPLAPRLRLAVTRLARRLRQEAADPDLGLSPTGFATLATIERRGPLTLGALAAHERVAPPTITAAVGRLEQHGLVARAVDPSDRRVHRVSITADGRRVLERVRTRKTQYLERRLAALSPDDRATLEAAAPILERLLQDEP